MRITKLALGNFRGVKELQLSDLPGTVFLCGLNGAGKTSVQNAVQHALCGRCYDQRGARIKVADLIGPHDKAAVIWLQIEHNGETYVVDCRITKSGTGIIATRNETSRISGSPDEVRAALWACWGIDPTHAECALNPRAFLLSDDLTTLLGSLGSGVTREAIETAAGDHYSWLMDSYKLPETTNTETLRGIGDDAYKQRTAVNAELKSTRDAIARIGIVNVPKDGNGNPLSPKQIPGAQKLLAELRSQRDELLQERGRAAASVDAPTDDDINLATLQLSAAKKTADELKSVYESACGAHEKATAELKSAQEKQAGISYKQSLLPKPKAARGIEGDTCPTCGTTLTDELRAEIQEKNDAADHETRQESVKLNKQNEAALADITKAREACKKAESARSEANAALIKPNAEVQELRANLAALNARRAAVSARPVDDIDADISAIETRIESGESVVAALVRVGEISALNARLSELEETHTHLEWAISAFRDGALLNELSSGGQAEFLERANAWLADYGYALETFVDGSEIVVLMGRIGGLPVPVNFVSDGELILAQRAVAFGVGTGGIVAVDGLDRLDGYKKGGMFGESSDGTLLISAAWGLGSEPDLPALAAAIAPAALVWMQDGVGEAVVPAIDEVAA